MTSPVPTSRCVNTDLTPERFRQLEPLLDAALDLPPGARPAFIERSCAGDDELRRTLLHLIQLDDDTAPHPDLPSADLLSPLIEDLGAARGRTPRPDRAGPFRLVREIGRGGMGAVFLGERDDGQFEQRVAVKLVPSSASDLLIARFMEERRILAGLEHPGIARLVDGGIAADGTPWFAMEYVEGEPIDRWCDAHSCSLDQRLELLAGACDAVQYAHQHFVVHRDLKPSNMLVTAGGQLKLLDFGVAKLLVPGQSPDEADTTRSLLHAMTPEYAAPEQVQGRPVSAATDVYAFGVILYLLLTGQRPYDLRGRPPGEMERIICNFDPPAPSTSAGTDRLRRALAGDLDAIVLRALGKEPAARYASAQELALDIRRHLAAHPVQARRQTAAYRARRFVKRHRLETVAGAVVALSLVGGVVVSLSQAHRARAERDRAETASREAAATSAFLFQLFETTDTANVRGDTLTAGELVRRAEARVALLHDQPNQQARLLEVTGRVFQSLGQFEPARISLERAVALRQRAAGSIPDPAAAASQLAADLIRLSQLHISLSQFPAADSAARAALAIQQRDLEPDDPAIASTLHQLASVAIFRDQLADAESLHRRALAIRERSLGPVDSLTGDSHALLGAVLRREGRLDEAEAEFRQALATAERVFGPDRVEVTGPVQLLADLYDHDEGRDADAEPLYRRELAIREQALGEAHPLTAYAEYDLAEFLARRGDSSEAVSLARRFLATIRRTHGPRHPVTATALAQAADVLHRAGDFEESEHLFRASLALNRELRGRDNANVAGVEVSFARLLVDRRDFSAARAMIDDAVRIDLKVFGPDHPATARAQAVGGLLLLRERRYAAADSVLGDVLRRLELKEGRRHRDIREMHGWLAEAEEARGLHAEARRDRAIAAGQ